MGTTGKLFFCHCAVILLTFPGVHLLLLYIFDVSLLWILSLGLVGVGMAAFGCMASRNVIGRFLFGLYALLFFLECLLWYNFTASV